MDAQRRVLRLRPRRSADRRHGGDFWFFDASNVEIIVKVLEGCTTNAHRWVFASGLTNVLVNLTVTDVVTGATRPYTNPQSTPFAPIEDTSAFPCN